MRWMVAAALMLVAGCENPTLGHRHDDQFFGCQRVARGVGPRGQRGRGGVAVRVVAVLAVLALAACGVDGEPEPKGPGLDVSGQASIGVRGTL